jgi:Fe2+ transport system protein FeoA
MKPLHQLSPGEKAFIVDMQSPTICEKLFEMGVFPGDLVEVKENNAENNLLIVKINNNTYHIFKKAAATILTNVVSLQLSLN